MSSLRLVIVLAAFAALAGCATPNPYAGLARTGDRVADGNHFIRSGPPQDKVLWQYRTATASMRRGRYAEAKQLLDDALLNIGGTLGASDPSAKRARGFFSPEAVKPFIGEPYERVMAYFYRGLLYWKDGELDNARACFRSAQIQDADPENHEFASDYVLLDYLEGLVSAKLAGDGADALKRAREQSKIAIPPDYDSKANVLFFVEHGVGPSKYVTGPYGEQLRFQPGQSPAWEAHLKVDQQSHRIGPYDDLTFQATTRGGRVMDHILRNKAVFKTTTDAVGDAAIISGAILAGGTRHEEAGLAVLGAGLLSKIISAATKPEADVRAWDNLPQFLSFAALRLPVGQHAATVEFLDKSGRPISNLTKTVTINVQSANKDLVVLVSDQSVTPLSL